MALPFFLRMFDVGSSQMPLTKLGSLTLKYQTDIEVEVSEMKEECLSRASLFATSEDSTFRI